MDESDEVIMLFFWNSALKFFLTFLIFLNYFFLSISKQFWRRLQMLPVEHAADSHSHPQKRVGRNRPLLSVQHLRQPFHQSVRRQLFLRWFSDLRRIVDSGISSAAFAAKNFDESVAASPSSLPSPQNVDCANVASCIWSCEVLNKFFVK